MENKLKSSKPKSKRNISKIPSLEKGRTESLYEFFVEPVPLIVNNKLSFIY
jgi:hypothetical protein